MIRWYPNGAIFALTIVTLDCSDLHFCIPTLPSLVSLMSENSGRGSTDKDRKAESNQISAPTISSPKGGGLSGGWVRNLLQTLSPAPGPCPCRLLPALAVQGSVHNSLFHTIRAPATGHLVSGGVSQFHPLPGKPTKAFLSTRMQLNLVSWFCLALRIWFRFWPQKPYPDQYQDKPMTSGGTGPVLKDCLPTSNDSVSLAKEKILAAQTQ